MPTSTRESSAQRNIGSLPNCLASPSLRAFADPVKTRTLACEATGSSKRYQPVGYATLQAGDGIRATGPEIAARSGCSGEPWVKPSSLLHDGVSPGEGGVDRSASIRSRRCAPLPCIRRSRSTRERSRGRRRLRMFRRCETTPARRAKPFAQSAKCGVVMSSRERAPIERFLGDEDAAPLAMAPELHLRDALTRPERRSPGETIGEIARAVGAVAATQERIQARSTAPRAT